MEKIYYSLRKFKDLEYVNLPSNIVSHLEKYHLKKQKDISTYAWISLGKLMEKVIGKNILNQVFFSNNGKPLLKDFYVSISHEEEYVLVSLSKINHGVDIEKIKENYNEKAITKFHDIVIKNKEDFFLYWTRRETIIKVEDISLFSKVNFLDYNFNSFIENDYMISIGSKEEEELIRVNLDEYGE